MIFSALTSKLFGGAAIAIAVVAAATLFIKNREISGLQKDVVAYQSAIKDYQLAVGIWKVNARSYELGLDQCNAGVLATASAAKRINAVGVAAIAEVKKAGASVDRKVAAINALPATTCEDAMAILKRGGE